ncbi:hypothetical protein G6F68_016920 [Rhizopus microsporus]|nr:hypothetical protein G6F68_016920 [Rhizopus microsporus]
MARRANCCPRTPPAAAARHRWRPQGGRTGPRQQRTPTPADDHAGRGQPPAVGGSEPTHGRSARRPAGRPHAADAARLPAPAHERAQARPAGFPGGARDRQGAPHRHPGRRLRAVERWR